LKRHRLLILRWLKFSTVGWMGVGVQLAMLTLLAGQVELHYLVATVLAVESAIIHNFFWHERWTWRDRGLLGAPGRLQRLLRFNLGAGLISITGNVVFMSVFVGKLGLHYLIGNLASIAACAILNFLVSDRLVFLAVESKLPTELEDEHHETDELHQALERA
jgi:putative flippase GtrA